MLLPRLFLWALLVGFGAGLAHTAAQHWQVVPIIVAAEVYESASESVKSAGHEHDAGTVLNEHRHDTAAWQPEDGVERTVWTLIANVLVSTGFALLLLPAIAWWDLKRGGRAASLKSGLLWGAAGWFCLFAWPSLGLSPEIPGEAAAALQARQSWWLLAVLCAAGGLATLTFARGVRRAAGLAVLALPFVVGAPRLHGSAFPEASAEAAAQLAALKSQFILATAMASALQWLALGALAGLVVTRCLRRALVAEGLLPSGLPRAV